MARRVRKGRDLADPNLAWSREKLLGLLVAVGLGVVVVVVGLALAVVQAVRPAPAAPKPSITATTFPAQGQVLAAGETRDAAANRPWPAPAAAPVATAGAAAPLPGGPDTTAALTIPKPTRRGGVHGIDTGYPHTPEGAVGQLASIDQTLLSAMRVEEARAAYAEWAMPGGVGADNWIITRNIEAFTGALAKNGGSPAVVSAMPVSGQVRAVDGGDWVLACVLLDVTARVRDTARIGYGHCERMQWSGDRWLIAPGSTPAQPSPVTAGSTQAQAAGWRPLAGFGASS